MPFFQNAFLSKQKMCLCFFLNVVIQNGKALSTLDLIRKLRPGIPLLVACCYRLGLNFYLFNYFKCLQNRILLTVKSIRITGCFVVMRLMTITSSAIIYHIWYGLVVPLPKISGIKSPFDSNYFY